VAGGKNVNNTTFLKKIFAIYSSWPPKSKFFRVLSPRQWWKESYKIRLFSRILTILFFPPAFGGGKKKKFQFILRHNRILAIFLIN
jgi:hypothetical protein